MPGRSIAFAVFVVLLVLAHLVLHVALGYGSLAPDFVAVATLLAARRLTGPQAAGLGLVLGLLADSLAVTGFGAGAVVLVIAGWVGSRTRDLFEGESYGFTLVYLFLGKWLVDALYLLISPATRGGTLAGALLVAAPLYASITAAAGLFALAAFRQSVGGRYGR